MGVGKMWRLGFESWSLGRKVFDIRHAPQMGLGQLESAKRASSVRV
jgi:hypothetical protein